MAFDAGTLSLRAPVRIRMTDVVPPAGTELPEGWEPGQPITLAVWLSCE